MDCTEAVQPSQRSHLSAAMFYRIRFIARPVTPDTTAALPPLTRLKSDACGSGPGYRRAKNRSYHAIDRSMLSTTCFGSRSPCPSRG